LGVLGVFFLDLGFTWLVVWLLSYQSNDMMYD
jgi:hypothetical protein